MTQTRNDSALASMDQRYDSAVQLVSKLAKTPGYHTRIADGTKVHETREAADYAMACLRTGESWRIQRGEGVLRRLLPLQETDPLAATFGIWSWFYEEPLSQMNPPDWNWADFIGSRLLMIYKESAAKLPEDLRGQMRQAIENAAMSIFRRNVTVGYTNIAIMGAGVSAAAGELIDQPLLLQYGRNRLRAVLGLLKQVGTFSEYNSPTYTMIAIEECERILYLVRDNETRQIATQLHAAAWKIVAEHWHQPTGQWAGPHARAYSDRLTPATLRRISHAIGTGLPGAAADDAEPLELIPVVPCPPDLVSRFTTPIATPRITTLTLDRVDGEPKVATTWLAPTCCLSSATRENTWNQRRNILAYWNGPENVAVFKTQWLLDGKDMSGMRIAANQVENRLLMALYPLHTCGAFHPNFDIRSIHPASDLRFRFLLSGRGARLQKLSDNVYDLACGDHSVRITLAPAEFDGRPVQWQLQQQDDQVNLDGICLSSPAEVNFQTLRLRLVAALQLLRPGEGAIAVELQMSEADDLRRVDWPGSGVPTLSLPLTARPYSW